MHDVAEAVRGLRGGAGDLSAGELRSHLCPAGPDAGGLAGGARPGAGDGGRPPVALPADDRARDAVRRARGARPAARPADGRARRPTCTRATQEICARGRARRPTRSRTTPGPGAESRHNLVYWRYGDYAGIGPGAHGRLTVGGGRWATEALRAPEAWLDGGRDAGRRRRRAARRSRRPEQAIEMLLMGLRLARRHRPRALRRAGRRGRCRPSADRRARPALGLRRAGAAAALRATAAGRPVLDAMLRSWLAESVDLAREQLAEAVELLERRSSGSGARPPAGRAGARC